MQLSFGLKFSQLYEREGLVQLDQIFLQHLSANDPSLCERLNAARQTYGNTQQAGQHDLEQSHLILALAPRLEAFLGQLFNIEAELLALKEDHESFSPLLQVKKRFVQRQALRQFTQEEVQSWNAEQLSAEFSVLFTDLAPKSEPWLNHAFEEQFAARVLQWTQEANEANLDLARRYAAWAVHSAEGQRRHCKGIVFRLAQGIDPGHLIRPLRREERLLTTPSTSNAQTISFFTLPKTHWRQRHGFSLTDPGCSLGYAMDQANYCIHCHEQGKDSCRTGLSTTLHGCPLDEKISEFHQLKAQGLSVAALAVICIDNPMLAATGHRICNDCMKSCIFQRQDPVNIPEVETRTLKDVLGLPWGFEIYSLLTRWNPLNFRRPLPLAETGSQVLVVGMGPAGFTLAHHLLNDGHRVVGIDGLKIEPLTVPFEPILNARDLEEDLATRNLAGFGGVAEYGITVRWNKNFLKLIRLLLERRSHFELYGGVRFGGTMTAQKAFEQGFDHIALAVGAGQPASLDIANGLARGVRVASDFLMGLQLTGAGQHDSLANLQVRLPIVVIGGGLTAIDTATEALAYYAVQVEKFLTQTELLAQQGRNWRSGLNQEDLAIGEEFIAHAKALRSTQDRIALLRAWGGATIAYRKPLTASPAHRLNHEEVEKALQEGIMFVENLVPVRFELDRFDHVQAAVFSREGEEVRLKAGSIFIAAGTSPNTILVDESQQSGSAIQFARDGSFFAAVNEHGDTVRPEVGNPKPQQVEVLLHKTEDGRYISFFGDAHPSYSGNVVKAMASAKQGYPIISKLLAQRRQQSALNSALTRTQLADKLNAHVRSVRRLTPDIVEVVIRAPWAAEAFAPGQFFRLQNFREQAGAQFTMEGLALTGAWSDPGQGLIGTVVIEMGVSSRLCERLQVGEPVVLMGPTGMPTEIPKGETVLLVGGGLGNAVLFSIGASLRAAGCRVVYFAGYKRLTDRFMVEAIEAAADIVVWCCDESPGFRPSPHRPLDRSYVGNMIDALESYGQEALTAQNPDLPRLDEIQRLITIGSDRLMGAVAKARHNRLRPYFNSSHRAIGSINSPMQCMMKGICGQCLQQHRDPRTGKVTVVFSCQTQDQDLDHVDWDHLDARLTQNRLGETISQQILESLPRLK